MSIIKNKNDNMIVTFTVAIVSRTNIRFQILAFALLF